MRTKRRSRSNRGWIAIMTLILVGAILGLGYYGSSYFGVPGLSNLLFQTPADSATISNITLTSYPELQDGYAGASVSAEVSDRGTASIQNTTIWLNDFLIGSCASSIQPQHHAQCRIGKDVPCSSFGHEPPYTIKVKVGFQNGQTYSTTGQVTTQISSTC